MKKNIMSPVPRLVSTSFAVFSFFGCSSASFCQKKRSTYQTRVLMYFASAALFFYASAVKIVSFIHYNLMDNKGFGGEQKVRLEENICVHIFTVSAAMVGVCLTVIGIIQIVITSQGLTTLADDFIALDALFFLISSFLSYWAMRRRGFNRIRQIEHISDIVFISALVVMAFICIIITYEISFHKIVA